MLEFSIVMAIIGVLAAGVLVGRSMIENAETRVIITEMSGYNTALKEFADKYFAVPGDMNNAETVWGSDTSCPTTPTNTDVKMLTCNGDGNGVIGDWANGSVLTADSEYEWFRAWQQLANAEMIEGRFTGVPGSAGSADAVVGVNVPASRAGKGGWTLLWMRDNTDSNYFFSTLHVASHVLFYGAQSTGSITEAPVITASNAKAIDSKMDDGMPFTGSVRTKRASAGTCAVSSATTSDYLLTSTDRTCQLMFILGK